MTKFIFRTLLIFGGLVCLYISASPMYKMITYKINSETVEGRVIGFTAGGGGTTLLSEDPGIKNGKRKARRPVVRYPITNASMDSLDLFSTFGVLATFSNFNMDEKVNVVLNKTNASDAYMFSSGIVFTQFLIVVLSIFMLYIGAVGKLG